jgi:hypothetical protein
MKHKYSDGFLDTHRDINVDHDWWGSVYDDFQQICEIMGIELETHPVKLMNGKLRYDPDISFSGFWSQGDGASWTGRYRAQGLVPTTYEPLPTYDLAPAKIREHAPNDEELHRIADELCFLARIYGPTTAKVGRNCTRYSHEMTMQIDEWEPYFEEHEDRPEEVATHIEETLLEQFRDLARWLYSTLENEHDYLTSDEAVAETLEANEIYEEEEEECLD